MNQKKWIWLGGGIVLLLIAGLCVCVMAGMAFYFFSIQTKTSGGSAPDISTRAVTTREVQISDTEAAPHSTPRPGWMTFEDPDGFYQIDYLPDWETFKSGSEQQFCRSDRKVCVAISLQVKSVSGSQVAEETRAFLEGKMPDYVVSSSDESNLGGLPAVWLEHSYTENAVPVSGFLVGTIYNRIGYLILVWAPAEEYPGLKADLQSAVRSFQVVASPVAPPYDQWKTRVMENLTLHYLPDTWVEEQIDYVAAQHQKALAAIQKALNLPGKINTYPNVTFKGNINIYLYPSEEALYRSTARQSGFAINEVGEVHVMWISADDHQTPGHELTHVITYAAWKDPSQALLGEGLAACLDQSGRDYQMVGAGLLDEGTQIPLVNMVGDDWFNQDASISYPESGSVACYILEQYGIDKVKELYSAEDFESVLQDALGVDLAGLESGWLKWAGRKD